MDWRDEGFLISARRHGESSAIVEVFTAAHGKHAGVVRGGGSRRLTPVLQPGSRLSLEWSARLEDHIGTFRVDPIGARTAQIMADRAALAALGSVVALIGAALPERAAHPVLYVQSLELIEALGGPEDWPARYALWELALLGELGFGLDLARCAATGETAELAYVSPRSGRAVSRAGGAAWVDRLLPLPPVLRGEAGPVSGAELKQALALTGFFLEARLAPTLVRQTLPAARGRAVEAMLRTAGGR